LVVTLEFDFESLRLLYDISNLTMYPQCGLVERGPHNTATVFLTTAVEITAYSDLQTLAVYSNEQQ